MFPRLSIGIPTLGKRPDRLIKAIGSALGGSVPVHVIVADQSEDHIVPELIGAYAEHPSVRIIPTHEHAKCLWDNWCLAAEACQTEFFAWLQDDDQIAPHFGKRIIQSLDRFPLSKAWIARLAVSHTEGTGNWWAGCGPMVPMDMLTGAPVEARGHLMAAGAYFTSFALSPAVGFRVDTSTMEAIRRVPKTADLFAERSVLAELGMLGEVCCDPAVVGYWVQHETNESKFQNAAGGAKSQYPTMAAHIDALLDRVPGWDALLANWALCPGDGQLRGWLTDTAQHEGLSPKLDKARLILASVLRVDLAAFRPKEAAPEPEPEPESVAESPTPERAASRKAGRAERRSRKTV